MSIRHNFTWVAPAAVILATLGACSHDKTTIVNPDLPHFNDLTSATPKIQSAARAVVRISTTWELGTGSFISSTGLLLTNNHVLGQGVCPVEGCYIQISQLYQRGQTRQDPSTVMAVPVAVDIGLDMAVVQLTDPNTADKLNTPDFLTFDSQDSTALLDKHVTIVGHPEGNLKKWTDGVVVDASGEWFTCTAYTLPGDSGSPVLNDEGQIVGLIHRGPTSQDLFTQNGVDYYSIGTASAPIVAAMNATEPLPATMISKTAETTTAQFLANDFVYLNSHTSSITVGGTSVNALDVLGQACDTALARNDFVSPDDLMGALTPCIHAQAWIECQTDVPAEGIVCPSPSDQTVWSNRFQSVNSASIAMNGIPEYGSVSFAIAHLQPTQAAGMTAGAASLQQVLNSSMPPLDFELAYYLAAFSINSYNGTRIPAYIVNYTAVPHYELQANYIAYAASWLINSGDMSRPNLISFLQQLMADPKIDVGSKLSIEDFLYELDAL